MSHTHKSTRMWARRDNLGRSPWRRDYISNSGEGRGVSGVESNANVMERPVQLQEQFQERQVVFLSVFGRDFGLYHSMYECLVK